MIDRPYVIHHRRPHQYLLLALLAITIIVTGVWYLNQQWRQQQLKDYDSLQADQKQLVTENKRLKKENQNLMAQLEGINQMQAMQKATDSELQQDLQKLQQQLLALNKELLFYQNITQGNVSSELQVRELHLRSVENDPTSFHYRIVLTQGKKITKAIRGNVQLSLHFKSDQGENQRELSHDHELNIRHVQVLEGTLSLAENEQPDGLLVVLKQGKKTLAKRTFEWDVASP